MTGGGGGFDGASYCKPKIIHEPEILHSKKYKAKFYSQTDFKTKKIVTGLLIHKIPRV